MTISSSERAGEAGRTAKLDRIDHQALARIALETDKFGGATFPAFMNENMKRWERLGLLKIERRTALNETVAVITDAGRAALSAKDGR